MSLLPLLVCFKILIDPLPFTYLTIFGFPSPFCLSLGITSPPLSSMTTKGELKILDRLCETMISEDHFPNLVQSRSFAKDIKLGLIQEQASSHLQIRVIMHHVELNTYSSFSRLNIRFTSPQTYHMLPLDHFKHTSNSGTIQASNSFNFHE